ncbi:MAG: hypothetical protein AB1757_17890 [Acidobacteriota bacterium]
MKIHKVALANTVIGGSIYWIPSVFLHAIRGNEFSRRDEIFLTYFMPSLIAGILVLVYRWLKYWGISKRLFSISILLGIWILGPFFMFISASYTGGGFAQSGAWVRLLFGTLVFPITTFSMSVFDGTLYALLIITAVLILTSTFPQLLFIKGELK